MVNPRAYSRKKSQLLLTEEIRARILAEQRRRCFYCFRLLDPLLIDLSWGHFIPRSLGRPDGEENRVAACRKCDGLKAARLPTREEFERFRKLRENREVKNDNV